MNTPRLSSISFKVSLFQYSNGREYMRIHTGAQLKSSLSWSNLSLHSRRYKPEELKIRASLEDKRFVLQTIECSSKEAYGAKMQSNLSFRLPFGCYPSKQRLFNRPESEKFSYKCMILHVLDLAIDSLTGEIYFDSLCSLRDACCRRRLWLWRWDLLVYAFFIDSRRSCSGVPCGISDRFSVLIGLWGNAWIIQRVCLVYFVRGGTGGWTVGWARPSQGWNHVEELRRSGETGSPNALRRLVIGLTIEP